MEISDLEIDDDNREEMHRHRVSPRHAFELLDGTPEALPNRGTTNAPYLLVGPTSRGFVTLPIDPTNTHGLWRPRTGYPSKPADVRRYRQMGHPAR